MAGAGDPRVAAGLDGIAPMVGLPRGGPSWIVIAVGMAIFGVLLFTMLDSRRRAAEAPAVRPGAADRASGGVSAVPPAPLYVPPAPAPTPIVTVVPEAPVRQAPPPPQIVYVPQPAPPQPQPQPQLAPTPPPRASGDPALVYDGSSAATAGAPATADKEGGEGAAPASGPGTTVAGSRARSGVLSNRSATVPQGTLIPAVLETGLDSTRPGLARAMVTRDVRGFDGTRILIPRGSRLIGEYRSDTQPGQKRALVNWIRLIRPDGVTIAIGSPAGDPMGRGGIRANVNTHFFQRFAGAILQSTLDIGVNLASRSAGSPVIVALPGAVQNVSQGNQSQQITPTLTVRPGTSITIFVARDLDFTGAGARR